MSQGFSIRYRTPKPAAVDATYSVMNPEVASVTGFLSMAAMAFSTPMPSFFGSIISSTSTSTFRSCKIRRTCSPSETVPTTPKPWDCCSAVFNCMQKSSELSAINTVVILSITSSPDKFKISPPAAGFFLGGATNII